MPPGKGTGRKLELGWEGTTQGTAPLSFPSHPQSLLETHDSVASKTYETPPPSPGLDPTFSNQPVPPDAVRMVGIRKTAGEHLVRVTGQGPRWVWIQNNQWGDRKGQVRAQEEDGLGFAQERTL